MELSEMSLPLPPNAHALAVLLLTVIALILFTREKIPLESSSFLVLISLTVGFEIFPFHLKEGTLRAVDFFHGFGHEALVAVCALMIAGQGIVRTGALEPVGRVLAKLWKISPSISLLLTLMVGAFISAFINNVPVVVLFLPVLLSVSTRTPDRPAIECGSQRPAPRPTRRYNAAEMAVCGPRKTGNSRNRPVSHFLVR